MSHTVRWTIEKITQRLALIEPLVYCRKVGLPNFRLHPSFSQYNEPPSYWGEVPARQEGAELDGAEILPNTHWGNPQKQFTLRTTFQVPADWGTDKPLALYLPLGDAGNFSHPEALVYIDDESYAACDRHHQEVQLDPRFADGQTHELILQGWTGLGDDWGNSPVTKTVMQPCFVVQVDPPTREFTVRARVALGTAKILDGSDPVRMGLLNALDHSFKLLDTREPFGDEFYTSVIIALVNLTSEVSEAGAPLNVTMTATGHAHIDVAWLWTLDQTRQKSARTFHTVLRLMEQFPDYHFTQSQPQLYEFIRQDHPALFEAIREKIAEGRWEPIGGMWVEADCNLSGAEALARQFLLGRSYFRKHFGAGAESPVLWLPDVFGYSWALPQLIKQANLEYFFTIKIGWNQYNRLPYDSFWWQGLDGTRVLTHFSTAPENGSAYTSTYNAPADPESALYAWKNFQQKEIQREVFMAFGYGDGGGGPTREMLENLNEMANFPGLPRSAQRSAKDFFRDLEANSGPNLPTWNGELYLEYHRGTYTTQGRNKRANRKSEIALHDAEFLACLAAWMSPGYHYPQEILQQAWQLVCLNQFHDIIPGSSIGEVYRESLEQYAQVEQATAEVKASALEAIASQVGGDVLLINPTSFPKAGLALIPGIAGGRFERQGTALVSQATETGLLVDAGELPPYSVTRLTHSGRGSNLVPEPARERPTCLENAFLRVEFNTAGDIVRIYDKGDQREVLPPGAIANQLQAFEDRPKSWDAWDIDIYYDDRIWLAEPADAMHWVESGPLRWTIETKRRILNSTCTQRISLARSSARLDFETQIEWCERHILLKAAFPVDILSPVATYDIQWGNVQRPTHRNTSWDWARFETCAHKWVDLSEGNYGVSLLNDCKYGHDVRDNVLRISLLRSSTVPDPTADQGEHCFNYSLLPHAGTWEKDTVAEAYALNDPMIVYQATARSSPIRQAESPFVQVSEAHVIIETIKKAEDGQGYIVRLYENQRRRGNLFLSTAFALASVYQCNLLEENQHELPYQDNQVRLTIKPYEIISLRLIAKKV